MVPSPKKLAVLADEQETCVLMLRKDWDGNFSDKGVDGEGIQLEDMQLGGVYRCQVDWLRDTM